MTSSAEEITTLDLLEDGRPATVRSLSARGEVLAIDVESGEILGVLPAGLGPDGVAFTPNVVQPAPPTED